MHLDIWKFTKAETLYVSYYRKRKMCMRRLLKFMENGIILWNQKFEIFAYKKVCEHVYHVYYVLCMLYIMHVYIMFYAWFQTFFATK